jgi:hypothetical protein
VVDELGAPVEGVRISSGGGINTATDLNGDYTLTGLAGDQYHNILPSKSGYAFTPMMHTVYLDKNKADWDFTTRPITGTTGPDLIVLVLNPPEHKLALNAYVELQAWVQNMGEPISEPFKLRFEYFYLRVVSQDPLTTGWAPATEAREYQITRPLEMGEYLVITDEPFFIPAVSDYKVIVTVDPVD